MLAVGSRGGLEGGCGLGGGERLAPISLLSSFFFYFFFVTGGDRPLRAGGTLHLVREEILLGPLYDPQPSRVLLPLLLLLLGQEGGRV